MIKKERFLVMQAAQDRVKELQIQGLKAWYYKDHIGIFVAYETLERD